MNKDLFVDSSLSKLNNLLAEHNPAEAPGFAGKAQSAAFLLPGELAQPLRELAEAEARLKADSTADDGALADFAFRCGQVYEQLSAYRRIEMELENVRVGPDSVEAAPLHASQADVVARFIQARDRVFRKVADFTLKALLAILALLALGLVLGLV